MNSTSSFPEQVIFIDIYNELQPQETVMINLKSFITIALFVIILKSVFSFLFYNILCLYYLAMDTLFEDEEDNEDEIIQYIIEDNYNDVIEFNRVFGVEHFEEGQTNERRNQIIDNGFALIKEEFNELTEALENRDIIEVKDALCDMIYVIYGLMYRMNYEFITEDNIERLQSITNLTEFYEYLEFCKLNVNEKVNATINNDYLINLKSSIYNIITLDLQYVKSDKTNTIYLINLLRDTYIMGHLIFGEYKFTEAFNIVHSSNMSKLCSSEGEANETVASYKQRYEAGDVPYDTPEWEHEENSPYWIVKNRSTGKVLKNINYRPVEDFEGWN